MPFTYDKQQRAFIDAVTALVDDHQPVGALDAAELRDELWQQMVALDLAAASVPSEYDGLGLAPVELVGIIEAAARSVIATPLTMTAGAFTPAVAGAAATDERARAVLAQVMDGSTGTLAPTGHCPELRRAPRATLNGGRLTVDAIVVPDAGADLIAVPAVTDGGAEVLVVGAPLALGVVLHDGIGRGAALGTLTANELPIDEAVVATHAAAEILPMAWTAAAAELVGLAAELVARSVAHAQERAQFGQTIGHFQGVKHRLADAYVGVERARSLTMYAGLAIGEQRPDATRAAHRAKAAASEAASNAAAAAVQIHGAAGIAASNPISLLYLRAREKSMLLGGPDAHYACACLAGERSDAV